MWTELFLRYWRVATFKETPGNTPYSVTLLGFIALFFLLLIILQWRMVDIDKSYSPIAAGSLLLSYGVYTYLLLFAFRVTGRFVQTLGCLLATHAIVHLCAFPLLLMTPWLLDANSTGVAAFLLGIIYLIFTLILTIWQFIVTIHIYKHALQVDYLPASLASIGLIACNILIVSLWR